MKKLKFISLLLATFLFATHSFGQAWKQYADSAEAAEKEQRMDKAIEYYIQAKEELKKDPSGMYDYSYSYNLKTGEGSKDSVRTDNYAVICNNLAGLYSNKGQYKKAETLFLEVKQMREKMLGKEDQRYAVTCNDLAILYQYMGQYEKAERLYLEAKQIDEKVLGRGDGEYANICDNLAYLYMEMGRYDQAEPLFLEAKQIQDTVLGKEDLRYASTCKNLAILYMTMGQHEKAERLFLESKEIAEKVSGKENNEYAILCNNLALLYREMSQYKKAEPLFLKAKQINEKVLGKQHPNYATTCIGLAGLYQEIGQYEKAELLFLEAKQINNKILGKENNDYTITCNNLALLYSDMRQYKKAELLFLEAKKIQEKILGKEHDRYATTCHNLATLYLNMGQYSKAELLFLESKEIAEKVLGKQHPNYANSCNNLALLYKKTGQYEKAELLCLESKQINEKVVGKQHPSYGISCKSLANLYWLLHQPLQAESEFEEVFSVNVYNLSSVFEFTNEKEKAAYVKNITGEDDQAYSFYVSGQVKSGLPYSLSLFHRNLILSASQALKKQLFSTGDTTISNKYNEWVGLKQNLAVNYSKPIAKRKDVTEMEQKAGDLEKELTRLSSSFAKQQQRVDWKDIQSKLQAGEASIEFASFRWNDGKRRSDTVLYVALVLRKDSLLPAMVTLFNEQQLKNLLPAAGNKTTHLRTKRLYTLGGGIGKGSNLVSNKSAYKLIWEPLEKELKGIHTVYFALSGLLHRIAFAALPVNNKEVLSDRYKLVQLSTTASVLGQQPSFVTTSDKIQLYGGIKYNADPTVLKKEVVAYHDTKVINRALPDNITRGKELNELPGTKKELAGIVSLSNAYKSNITLLSGIKATEESIKALDGKASPGIIHIATHGFFFPDPKADKKRQGNVESGQVFRLTDDPLMRSGLLFAGANSAWQNKPVEGIDDGILTAYEVANLYLPNTKLVVLSACETGLGDIQGNEGVYGLQRAFKMAGVQNLVMSLWKVPDAETAEFMQAFYKNLFAKQAISDAFYGAQKLMKDKYRAQPYKWAAWVLVR